VGREGFPVHRNRDPRSWRIYPYLVDVQSPAVDGLATRVVIPLSGASGAARFPLRYLMPAVTLDNRHYVAVTPQLTATECQALGPRVGTLSKESRDVESAIEILLYGF